MSVKNQMNGLVGKATLTREGVFFLIVALVVNVLFKAWKWDEPIETDMFTYCMGGHAFLNSKLLYFQLWDQKPPLAHFIYGCVELLFGYGKTQIRAVNIYFHPFCSPSAGS